MSRHASNKGIKLVVGQEVKLNDLVDNTDNWEEAVIVFTQDSFEKEYTETERSYGVHNSSKYFHSWMGGFSLYGRCLDGIDMGVRLEHYMQQGWKIERVYVTKL